jgi:iturin family lipopeptide synthetase A
MTDKTVFVFSGIGTQWQGMAESLLASDTVFLDAIHRVDTLLSPLQGWSLLDLLSGSDIGVSLNSPQIAHPAIFAVQYALSHSLLQQGFNPAAVIGHSAGEVAAAVCADALSLPDAARLVAAHSELIGAVMPGAMLHVALGPEDVAVRFAAVSAVLELAAINSGQATVIAGTPEAIAAFAAQLTLDGIDNRILKIQVPFHTRAVEPHLEIFRARIADICPRSPNVPIYSSLRGGLAQNGDFSADYWGRHIRQPVQFANAAEALLKKMPVRCVEISPHPALLQHLATIAATQGTMPELEATLQRGIPLPAWPPNRDEQLVSTMTAETIAQALEETATNVLGKDFSLQKLGQLKWTEIGCTSLQITHIMAQLSGLLDKTLSVTLPYRYTTPNALIAGLTNVAQTTIDIRATITAGNAPVAIIGMACRFPGGANNPDALWQMLASNIDPVSEIPAERWSADAFYSADRNIKGRSVSRWGSFISGQDLRDFDARHFRMTPHEASALDPQQRLLLEVTWEALENAGIAVESWKGKQVGVYVGLSTDDYKNSTLYAENLEALDPYAGAGSMSCTAAGRLSYFFGWEGPNLALDTACSSSLVALHLARQALQSGECDLAVVGGVNAILTPHLHVYFSKAGILSPTGRCHVFDDAADGYVRAEGCGMLVLERTSDAIAAGRRPRAQVLGSAINQDGASTGFSTPNGVAQSKVLRQAWAQSGITANDLGYLEAHGTGTPIGDPIELEAIAESVAAQRTPQDPVAVGSIKSNLGHLEAAAGVAAVIKTVLALEHAELPANLHFNHPNSHIEWDKLPLHIVDRHQAWPKRGGRRIAGISSFGFSGTNAHAVLEQAPAVPDAQTALPRQVQVLALGAPDQAGLRLLAQEYAQRIKHMDRIRLVDLACSTHIARPNFASRVTLAAHTPAEISTLLNLWAEEPARINNEQLFTSTDNTSPLVFAFTGQGCQYPGMAHALYHSEPVFRTVLDRCENALRAFNGDSILALMLDSDADATCLGTSQVAQPAIFAMQCGIVALLASWGIRPDRVVGHSVGEFAAAVAAGVMTLEEGLLLVAQRGNLIGNLPAGGAMAAVQVDEQTARQAIGIQSGEVTIAAVNGPRSIVLSGRPEAIDIVLERLGNPGKHARRLVVSHAYHSPSMSVAAEAFALLPAPDFQAAQLPWISSVDGSELHLGKVDMAYWSRQILAPVHFDSALGILENTGCRTFVEIGPAAVLTILGRARAGSTDRLWIPTQQRQRNGELVIATALAALAARGQVIDWVGYDNPLGRRHVDLPSYPFQRRRHWREPVLPSAVSDTNHIQLSYVADKKDAEMTKNSSQPSFNPPVAITTLRTMIAGLTGLLPEEIDADTALIDMGLDSLILVQLQTLIVNDTGVEVNMVDFYGDLDTLTKLSHVLPASVPQSAPLPAIAEAIPAALPQHIETVSRVSVIPQDDMTRIMALQLETISRVISEQNALLTRMPTGVVKSVPAPAIAAPVTEKNAVNTRPDLPNFRSLKLDDDTFTPQQKIFVEDLTRRYVARTARSRALADNTRHTLADWKNTLSFRYSLKEMMYPIVAATSHGSHFTDLDGNDFLDITMGCGVALLGHSPHYITEAVHAQVDASFAIGPQTPLAAEVAERFSRITGLERVTFCNTGAEAVMMAVRIARAVTGRNKVAIFAGAYHGTWDGVLGVEHEGQTWPIAAGIPQGMVEDLLILNYGTDEALTTLRKHAHELAAVLVEPVQSRRPGLQPGAFLKEVRTITQEADCVLIFDEMITGFRILPGGAQAHFGIKADLATYGKIVGGGLPLSVVAGSARFMDVVDGGSWQYGDTSRPRGDVIYFGGTYIKHPLALAAARAALDLIETIGVAGYEELNLRSTRMADTLNAWFTEAAVPLTVVHFGSQFRIDGIGRYSGIMQPIELDLFFLLLNLRSIYVWERRICFLSFAHTDEEVDHIIACVKEAVHELRNAGFEFRSGGKITPSNGGGLSHNTGTGKTVDKTANTSGPATSAQRRMFALAEIEGPSVVYNVPLAIQLHGPLNLPRLEHALTTLVARHPALRTRFAVEEDILMQRIEPVVPFTITVFECTAQEITQQLAAFVQPFKLTTTPLFRTGLLHVENEHHVLIMDAHHIVVDGLSLNILAQQLMACYAGKALPDIGADMLDHAAAEAAYLLSSNCRRDAEYWLSIFQSVPEPLQLPVDHARPLRRRHRGADLMGKLNSVATARLKAAARTHKMSLFPLLLTLYATLLHRICAQDDIVIGLPVGGRNDPRFGNTVGMLASTLPLRLVATPEESLGTCARNYQKTFLTALGHQAYPLEALIATLDLPRDTSRNPLFDTMFIVENGNDRVYRMPGLECIPETVSRQAAMFDLSMEVVEAEDELTLRCEYDIDLFSLATAQGMLDTYLRLLHLAPDMLDLPVGQLNLLDTAQRSTLLTWGDGGAAPAHGTILDAFDAQCQRTPDAPALACDGNTMSYRELSCLANRLAHTLLADGPLAPDTLVALVSHRDANLTAGLLAILRAGTAYVPVDPDFPPERVRLMLQASGCRHLLASSDLIPALPALPGIRILRLDAPNPDAPDTTPVIDITPEHLAYVIFTSGSTGTPKGTMLRHRNAAAFFAGLPQAFGFTAGDRILAVTTVSFDIAALELLGALCCGMTVVLASATQARDPALLHTLIQQQHINVMQMTPTRLRMLIDGAGEQVLAQVRTLLVGGEALPQVLAEQLLALPHLRVFNVYGPTETTIWSAYWPLVPGPVSLGRALPGEHLLVLSSRHRLQPCGAVGEIAIAGAGVACGYLNDPVRTAERFITLPGIEGPVYLTGDLGRWRHDATLEYLGRRDDQVKIRGMRIEIGEIEHHLRGLPQVQDAVAAARQNALGETEIVAYLVGEQLDINPAALRTRLAAHLPAAMIPARFILLEALPQTPNGKTDRRALPEPETVSTQGVARDPNGPIEAALVRIFSDVLGHPVGPDDDFFLCGGHSLKAIQTIGKINRELGSTYTLRDLYRASNAAGLAQCSTGKIAPVTRAPAERDYPLSYAQQALWVLDQMQPGYAGYNVPGAYLIKGTLDNAAFSYAWGAVAARHASLRTVFRTVEGAPRQQILDRIEFPIEQATANNPEQLAACIAELTCRPFNLANGPLLRIALIPIDAQRQVLLLVTHHIISDGWSDALLINDLSAAYRAALAWQETLTALLPAPAINYADFAVWQQRYLASPLAQTHADYWRRQLQGLPLLELPIERNRNTTPARRGARIAMHLNHADAATWLAAIPTRQRYATLVTATLALLHLESGQTDLVLGLPIANRDRPELQDQVGLHLNTLPLRQQLQPDDSLTQLRDTCTQAIMAAMEHADYPFARLVDELGLAAEPGRHPVFDAMLIFHQQPMPVPQLDGLEVTPHDPQSYSSRFDLDFEIWTADDAVHGFIEYDTDLFSAAYIKKLVTHWQAILLAHASQPALTLNGLRRLLAPQQEETARFLAQSLALDEEF